jgi:hypothetical protein
LIDGEFIRDLIEDFEEKKKHWEYNKPLISFPTQTMRFKSRQHNRCNTIVRTEERENRPIFENINVRKQRLKPMMWYNIVEKAITTKREVRLQSALC